MWAHHVRNQGPHRSGSGGWPGGVDAHERGGAKLGPQPTHSHPALTLGRVTRTGSEWPYPGTYVPVLPCRRLLTRAVGGHSGLVPMEPHGAPLNLA